ncbi:uncharacterized protein BJ212DRAFT_1477888 [Suillus subaureus]|uniref:Uncharacterized protein n=1 Tax=Suillus subaureus TaxID=48587 RepID=A0A9P7EIC3_9AGAM|nr:uncharacterized protein BJ212DRAFT_1477888 [Suillus subaureus]KAG1822059.1 hypothetical protein BJ212DRAFT_1477888 [Suillus subaureus]
MSSIKIALAEIATTLDSINHKMNIDQINAIANNNPTESLSLSSISTLFKPDCVVLEHEHALDVKYKTVILDIQMDDVEQLDMQTDAQRKEIEDLISLWIQNEMEGYQAIAVIRDKIINLMDYALL